MVDEFAAPFLLNRPAILGQQDKYRNPWKRDARVAVGHAHAPGSPPASATLRSPGIGAGPENTAEPPWSPHAPWLDPNQIQLG